MNIGENIDVNLINWKNWPIQLSLSDYQDAIVKVSQLCKSISPKVEVFQLGEISKAGISDVDVLLVLGGEQNHQELNTIPKYWGNFDEKTRYIASHLPVMVLPRRDFIDLSKIFPVTNLKKLDNEQNSQYSHYNQQVTIHNLLSIVEITTLSFCYMTVKPMLEREIDVREMLQTLNTFPHEVRILRKFGILEHQWDVFCDDIRQLRQEWFELERNIAVIKLYNLLLTYFDCKIIMIQRLAKFLREKQIVYPIRKSKSNQIRCVLDETMFFVDNWSADFNLKVCLENFQTNQNVISLLPIEFFLVFYEYFLLSEQFCSHFVNRFVFPREAITKRNISLPIAERAKLLNTYFSNLSGAGLEWGAPLYWGINPVCPPMIIDYSYRINNLFSVEVSDRIINWIKNNRMFDQMQKQLTEK